jgi:hypothetical protein
MTAKASARVTAFIFTGQRYSYHEGIVIACIIEDQIPSSDYPDSAPGIANDYMVPVQHHQEEGKKMKWYWWVLLLVLLGIVIIGGAIWRYNFWSGVF